MVRFALIGAGFIGTAHARNLAAHPGVDFALVADINAVRAADLAGRYGASAATDVDEVFAAGGIDAVLIASSTNTHAEYLQRAAAAGNAVFCEKPIDLDPDRARAAVAAVTNAGVPAMVDFNRRFDDNHTALRASVAAGEVGPVIDDGLYPGWYERMQDSYAHALAAFVSAMESKTAPVPSLADGFKAQLIAHAATQSLQQGVAVPVEY
jgi:predicted dehydrogenase